MELCWRFSIPRTPDPEAPFYRYNIAAKDTLELQPVRAYQACSASSTTVTSKISFTITSSIKFFLGRDNIREVLVMR